MPAPIRNGLLSFFLRAGRRHSSRVSNDSSEEFELRAQSVWVAEACVRVVLHSSFELFQLSSLLVIFRHATAPTLRSVDSDIFFCFRSLLRTGSHCFSFCVFVKYIDSLFLRVRGCVSVVESPIQMRSLSCRRLPRLPAVGKFSW